MKKLVAFMVLGSVILTGCSKEKSANEIEHQTTDSILVLKQSNNTLVWETTQIALSSENPINNTNIGRGQSAHAHGEYTAFGGSTTISFSGTQNNGGAHGQAEVRQESGPFVAHYILETTSVVIDDNEAIYGGVIIEVIANTFPSPPPPPPGVPAPPCNPNSVGNYVYFKVIDNGQGSNAPTDQYQGFVQSCFVSSDGAASFPWFIFGPANDVENDSDKIKVNN